MTTVFLAGVFSLFAIFTKGMVDSGSREHRERQRAKASLELLSQIPDDFAEQRERLHDILSEDLRRLILAAESRQLPRPAVRDALGPSVDRRGSERPRWASVLLGVLPIAAVVLAASAAIAVPLLVGGDPTPSKPHGANGAGGIDLSGVIFVVLAFAWAVYLIPKALNHHASMHEQRSDLE